MLCCNAFENLIQCAGERGLAVLVCPTKDGMKFALQMRAIKLADEVGFPKGPLPTGPTNLTLSGSMMIRYCPSCGKRLEDMVTANPKLFKELAIKHEQFRKTCGL